MRWSAAPLAAGLVCLVPAQDRPPGQQPPIFRSGVDVVQVEVSILDRDRRPVRGLTKQDFHVFENGDSQEIIDVQEIELDTEPAPPVWAHAAPVDVATNDLADRRLIAIVMDDLNCCAIPGAPPFMSDRWAIQNAVTTAHRLIDSLGPRDLATIALTHELMPIQRFTNDREALREVVRRFAPVTEGRCRPLPPYPRPEADLRWLLITSPQPVKAIVVLGSLVRINPHEVPFCPPRSYTLPDTGGRTVPVVPLSRTPPDLREHPHVPTYRLNVSGLQIDQRQRAFRNSGPNATGGRNFYLTNDLDASGRRFAQRKQLVLPDRVPHVASDRRWQVPAARHQSHSQPRLHHPYSPRLSTTVPTAQTRVVHRQERRALATAGDGRQPPAKLGHHDDNSGGCVRVARLDLDRGASDNGRSHAPRRGSSRIVIRGADASNGGVLVGG